MGRFVLQTTRRSAMYPQPQRFPGQPGLPRLTELGLLLGFRGCLSARMTPPEGRRRARINLQVVPVKRAVRPRSAPVGS